MAEVLKKKEIHVFTRFERNIAFDVNDLHIFEINGLTKEILQQVDGKTPQELTAALSNLFPPADVLEVLEQLLKLNLVNYRMTDDVPVTVQQQNVIPGDGIKKLTLLMGQACNLKCHYCFNRNKSHIPKKYMSKEVAKAAVDLLFRESNHVETLNIGFYGGEPMLQFDLIKWIISYTNQKADEFHKTIKYNMTTNGTLLTDEGIQFITENKIHTTISLDGNREIHDKNRVFPDGSGSFDTVFSAYTRLKEKSNDTTTFTVVCSPNGQGGETSSLRRRT
ncbi:MAG TPA: radical SAM protein, partial [Candidatus Kapabacteria bacterium]|nr:radical SAM protein [Candidatus Kapabacteria bacterium]